MLRTKLRSPGNSLLGLHHLSSPKPADYFIKNAGTSSIERKVSYVSGAGKTGDPHVKE